MLFWGANCSIRRQALIAAGGFDNRFVGWGWDDLELGYRLHRSGMTFRFDADAWCLHRPHARTPLHVRLQEAERNWIRTYDKHVHRDLELWDACDYWDQRDALARLMAVIGEAGCCPSVAQSRVAVSDGIVFYGYAPSSDNDRAWTVAPTAAETKGRVLQSFGLRTPFATAQFDLAVLSPYIDRLQFRLSPSRPTVSDLVIREAHRIARRVIRDPLSP
jgi:hypothetical protein